MKDRKTHGSLLLILVCATLVPLGLLASSASIARDDVPDEIAVRKNPEVLEESELRYYQRQYKGKCARCHGLEGDGGGSEAAPTLMPPADFTDAAFMKTRTDGQLFYQIREGGGDACAMPAYGPESDYAWKEEKIWHLVAFVRRFSEPTAD
jgi:mono/diheme cytochrome c family protein